MVQVYITSLSPLLSVAGSREVGLTEVLPAACGTAGAGAGFRFASLASGC